MLKAIAGGIVLVALAVPALAADETWDVRDSTTPNCTIVEEKPTMTTTTNMSASIVGNTSAQTRTEVRTWTQSCLD